ncbi:type VI secretion protein [Erwinia typographi]|uniref:Type VI secretion protein n=1 Tax=Erwinia typographi TaxID=371042 RepID=A0A0A3Z8M8_9GAMM|nr:lysozyme inhibitor LprI family protein [Erwinia typographi]KGT95215.1 type VI secretion protein [Erwinia typographi]
MNNKFLLGSAFGLFVMSVSAQAMEDCSKKTSDPDVFICAQNNRTAAEKELNKEYSEAKKRINNVFSSEPEVKKDYLPVFLEAQRGWLQYRDNQCKLYAHVADKNSNPYTVFTNNCIAKMDEERTKELKEIPYD